MRFKQAIAALAAALSAFGLSACGTSLQSDHPPRLRLLVEGRRVFAASCASCHTLSGHDTQATGGDLGLGHFTEAEVASFARIMPVHPALSGTSLRAVATYVATVQESEAR